jgi:hypothetical protein
MKGKVPVQDAWASRFSFPPPPPPSFRGAGGGRGGGMAGWVLFGYPERGRGVTLASQYHELESHLILARKIRGLESHLSSASYFGKSFRQVIWASLSGTSIWRGPIASKFGKYSVGFWNEIELKKRRVNCVYSVNL